MKPMISLGLRCEAGRLWILDQTLLPHQETWVECKHPKDMIGLIRRLAVRGAPRIGVAAGLAIGQHAEEGAPLDGIVMAAKKLREARPSAVNLMVAMDRLILGRSPERLVREEIVREAEGMFDED